MKIANISWNGKATWVMVDGGEFYPFQGINGDEIFNEIEGLKPSSSPLTLDGREVKWLPIVTRPSKIIAIGLNYMDHIEESKGTLPKNPIIFAKYPNSLIGHKDLVVWNRKITKKVDYEGELAIIIGKRAKNLDVDEADSVIAGYTCANDVSARDLQFGDGQWTRGKSLDTFCPLGPFLVTKDEVEDPQNLSIKTILNGKVMQDSNTSRMIFGIKELVSFLSKHMTLMPQDVILTGTPGGVGAFRNPPLYLEDGDEIKVWIESIGELVNYCRVIED